MHVCLVSWLTKSEKVQYSQGLPEFTASASVWLYKLWSAAFLCCSILLLRVVEENTLWLVGNKLLKGSKLASNPIVIRWDRNMHFNISAGVEIPYVSPSSKLLKDCCWTVPESFSKGFLIFVQQKFCYGSYKWFCFIFYCVFFFAFSAWIQDIKQTIWRKKASSSIWLRSRQHMLDDMTSGLASCTQSFGAAGWKYKACLCSCKWKNGWIPKWVAWHIFPMQLGWSEFVLGVFWSV